MVYVQQLVGIIGLKNKEESLNFDILDYSTIQILTAF